MARQSIQDLGSGENVESDQHDVVGEKHESSEFVGDLAPAEGVVSEVANILNLRVFHDESPHGHAGDVEKNTGSQHRQDATRRC